MTTSPIYSLPFAASMQLNVSRSAPAMAEQVSTLIIEANIECGKCYKKLQKVLCTLQEKEKIRTIIFDKQKNTVTISGPFDPVKLERKLRCMACGCITVIATTKPSPPPEKASPTTVNMLQFTQICNLCYPWPCRDPGHQQRQGLCGGQSNCGGCGSCRGGGCHQQPQGLCGGQSNCGGCGSCRGGGGHQKKQELCGGQSNCGGCGSCSGGGGHQKQKELCGGQSNCGGCGSCRGGGGGMPTCIGGPSSCRGCKGCRIVQEGRFIYEEYPASSCAVM